MTVGPAPGVAAGGWRPSHHPIRVGLVGLGNVGLVHHVPALLAIPELVRVVAVADPSPGRRELAVSALDLDGRSAYATPDELLARDDIDVVDLATPPHVRTPLAIRALESGRAILCEKPIALTPADGLAIAAAAEASGAPAAIIHNWLALREIVAVRAAIAEGAIGRPEVAILNLLGVETDRAAPAGSRTGGTTHRLPVGAF